MTKKMKIKIMVIALAFLITAFHNQDVFAQAQSHIGFKGNPEIAQWATAISNSLSSPSCPTPIYNRQVNLIRNNGSTVQRRQGDCTGTGRAVYFCTNLVTDSYRLAGKKTVTNEIYVPYMISEWKRTPGYKVLIKNDINSVSQLRTGDVIFLETSDHVNNHVVVISKIDIDSNGNGTIKIKQANSYGVEGKYTVSRWKVLVAYKSDKNTIVKFGLGPRI